MLRERPRIGITMRIELETDRFYLGRDYSEAVEAAGGVPVHVSLIPDPRYIAAVLDSVDGVLLPGSDSDVDPQRYGMEPHAKLGAEVRQGHLASKTAEPVAGLRRCGIWNVRSHRGLRSLLLPGSGSGAGELHLAAAFGSFFD